MGRLGVLSAKYSDGRALLAVTEVLPSMLSSFPVFMLLIGTS